MAPGHIICLYDFLRLDAATSVGVLDMIREPVRQGTGMDMRLAPGGKRLHGALLGFSVARFQALAAEVSVHDRERNGYYGVSSLAIEYLFSFIPPQSSLIGFEMPPWLRSACQIRGMSFIDVRYSPLRFGRDLYFALDASDPDMQDRLAARNVCAEELKLEASLLAASVRMHRGLQEDRSRHFFDLNGSLVFIGQHPMDVALLSPDGRSLSCSDFSEELHALSHGRRVMHMTDYSDELYGYGEKEREALSTLLGVPVRPCVQNAYQILSSHDDIVVTGISSPMLQEASWFERRAHMLWQPFVPLAMPENSRQGYVQIRFQDMIAPEFWHAILTPEATPPRLARLPDIGRHHAREVLDAWWDYEKVMTWQRTLALSTFERSGGRWLKQRVDLLEQKFGELAVGVSAPVIEDEVASRPAIQMLKDTKVGQTAYILGNGPSLAQFDMEQLLERESFWCNSVFQIADQGIEFRPKYYFIGDYIGFQMWADGVMNLQAGTKFFRNSIYRLAKKSHPDELARQNVIWYEAKEKPGMDMCDGEDGFSYDPSVKLFSGWTIVLEAIQFAFYMGYSNVYVAGVDLDYSKGYYFFEKENGRRGPSDEVTRKIYESFLVAKKHFEKNGRVLAKITESPNLPLDFVQDDSLRHVSP